jgi:hypothetical protein
MLVSKFECPRCQAHITSSVGLPAGKPVTCPQCHQAIHVPGVAATVLPVPEEDEGESVAEDASQGDGGFDFEAPTQETSDEEAPAEPALVNKFECPNCQSTMSSSVGLPPGKRVTCPKCRTPFVVPALVVPVPEDETDNAADVSPNDDGDSLDFGSAEPAAPKSEPRSGDKKKEKIPAKANSKAEKRGLSPIVLGSIIAGTVALLVGGGITLFFTLRGGGRDHEALVKATLESFESLSPIIASIKDGKSVEQAVPKLTRQTETMRKLKQELAALPKPSAGERKNIEQYTKRMTAAGDALQKSFQQMSDRLQTATIPERAKERLASAVQEYVLAMLDLAQEFVKRGI